MILVKTVSLPPYFVSVVPEESTYALLAYIYHAILKSRVINYEHASSRDLSMYKNHRNITKMLSREFFFKIIVENVI